MYRVPLFDPSALRRLRLLPTEYVYYHDQPQRAFENVQRRGETRAQAIAELTRVLFERLRDPATQDIVGVYRAYLSARSAGYMQIESGHAGVTPPGAESELSGYDRIALGVVRAIHLNANAIIPLSVVNRGTIPDLLETDVVEVPCVVNANGAWPLHVGRVPDAVRPLLQQVKEYERLTIRAAADGSRAAAVDALAANPLVPGREAAERLLADLMPSWR
jgi:6-phospho-beta-glucosidase